MERRSCVDADGWMLEDLIRAVLHREGAAGWSVEAGEFWCSVTPPGYRMPGQGWKLHVSATPLSAPVVLARCAEVLVRAGCAVKFARGFRQLGELLSGRCDRGSGGKFITAYPLDDDVFRAVVHELDRVTDGLPGPVILSDRPVRPGSLVHYRYGVFAAAEVFTEAGAYVSMLTGPAGQRVADERRPYFSPPPWAEPPIPVPVGAGHRDGGVVIGDRFEVRQAIRHSYRGGLFLATDRETGAEVVVKQARPHVLSGLDGTDARDLLRHEARMLDLVTPAGLAPRGLALVEQQENLFLVEELVPGGTLREWVADRDGRVPPAEAYPLAARLVELVSAVHDRGVVLGDLSPNNVMVTPERELRLVDWEHAVPVGARAARAFTPGYAGPERCGFWRASDPPSDVSGDLFGVGAILFFLFLGADPVLADDEPADRPVRDRLGMVIEAAGRPELAPLLLGLTDDDPASRWSLSRARKFLADRLSVAAPAPKRARSRPVPLERLLGDGLRYLLGRANPADLAGCGPDGLGRRTDPVNVHYGAAGILAVLTRAATARGGDELSAGVATVARWVDERRFDSERLLPGLYFGRSGTAWALHDAAVFLGDDALASRAGQLLTRIPVVGPNPDVTHGTAGAGLAHLHLWRATGDPELRRRIDECADGILAAARVTNGHPAWQQADGGPAQYGFAHGSAGIGAFLLACGRDDCLDTACRIGDALHRAADRAGGVGPDRAAWWPVGPDAAGQRLVHWCSGSSGVGTFLIRLWAATGERRHRALAEAAAAAVRLNTWQASNAVCHGLAGDGDFLLDLAEHTGDGRYRDWATELARAMYARHTVRGGLALLSDASRTTVTPGYGTGLAGALGFLLRLQHGGPRWWMPDVSPARCKPAEQVLTAA